MVKFLGPKFYLLNLFKCPIGLKLTQDFFSKILLVRLLGVLPGGLESGEKKLFQCAGVGGVPGPVPVSAHAGPPSNQPGTGVQVLNAKCTNHQRHTRNGDCLRLNVCIHVRPEVKSLQLALGTIYLKNLLSFGEPKQTLPGVGVKTFPGRLNVGNTLSYPVDFGQKKSVRINFADFSPLRGLSSADGLPGAFFGYSDGLFNLLLGFLLCHDYSPFSSRVANSSQKYITLTTGL